MKKLLILSFLLLVSSCNNNSETEDVQIVKAKNTPVFVYNNKKYKRTFSRSKIILSHVYGNNVKNRQVVSIYSGCRLKYIRGKLVQDTKNCPQYKARKNKKLNTLDWEHIVPASWYGQQLPCWKYAKTIKKNSRKYCAKVNPKYNLMESDLLNLVPAIAEINRDRSNFKFGVLRKANLYGSVDFEIDFKNKIVEPRDNIKGDIARVVLYMNSKYDINIPSSEIKMYHTWSKSDPITAWEKKKLKLVKKIQG